MHQAFLLKCICLCNTSYGDFPLPARLGLLARRYVGNVERFQRRSRLSCLEGIDMSIAAIFVEEDVI